MSNLLVIPFKTSRPVDIKSAVKTYIKTQHPETHPDAFRSDVQQWEALRKDAISGGVHVSRIDGLLRYQAQLVFILTKVPPDIGLEITYDPVFRTRSTSPLTAPNLHLELVCVVFNLASLYCQLARSQDRSQIEGIKYAINYYLQASSALAHIVDVALPALQASFGQPLPSDMTAPFFDSLRWLMLAQAQECALGRAIGTSTKSGLLSKIAMRTAECYNSAYDAIEHSIPPVTNAFPAEWRAHLQIKALQHEAFAHQQSAMENNANGRYGEEVGRLQLAQSLAKRAVDKANATSGIAKPVKDEVTKLRNDVTKELGTATKDNDMIYHKDVPPPEAMPKITGIDLVKATPISELALPSKLVGPAGDTPIFGDLLAHGARSAIALYRDRLENYIKDNIVDAQTELDSDITKKLHELSLPAALEALDKKIGLPPSLLAKSEEIRNNEGTKKIDNLFANVAIIATHCKESIYAAAQLIQTEAQQDAGFQSAFKNHPTISRLPSSHANSDLLQEALKYQQAFMTASESDEKIKQDWVKWKDVIDLLAGPAVEIEARVPSASSAGSASSTVLSKARALRKLLEQLDDLKNDRAKIVDAARGMADMDNIRRRVELEASAMEKWVEVKPAMFEDTIAAELEKYEKYREGLEENGRKQEELLEDVEAANAKYIEAQKRDPVVEQRKEALKTLYGAYTQYKQMVDDLSQGLEFYNKLSVVTTQLAEKCKIWTAEREAEIRRVQEALQQAATAPVVVEPPQQYHQHVSATPQESAIEQQERADVAMTSPRGPASQPLASIASPSPPTRNFQPRSKFIQNALERASPAPAGAPTAGPSSGSIPPSPWKETVYARELNAADADWEEEPSQNANVSPKKIAYAHELGNLNDNDDWDDGPVLPSAPVASTPLKGSGKKASSDSRSSQSTDRTPSGKSKTRSSRVPAT